MLDDAIGNAKKNNILMFSATSDQGSIASENSYSGKWENCIRIGAATSNGDKCTWVPEQFDYLLPGKNIPFKWTRPDGILSWYESGTSLATALAVGLYGLLLYCERAVHEGNPGNFQSKLKMGQLFKRMAATTKNHRYPRADSWFDIKFRTYRRDKHSESLAKHNAHRQKLPLPNQPAVSIALKPLTETSWDKLSIETLKDLLKEMESPFI